jgi:hypothetical protein
VSTATFFAVGVVGVAVEGDGGIKQKDKLVQENSVLRFR